jgi:tRNA-dihydrouridine synthase B
MPLPSTPLILAPLRGFTDVVFRDAFSRHFGGIDEAIAPFITATPGRRVNAAHLSDLDPAQNRGLPVIPQILGNDADMFVCLADTLRDMGYREINWNLGCPYPMVAKKRRGSGLLPYPDTIDRLLERIFAGCGGPISIKTRLGRYTAEEMVALIPVLNRYSLERVIVHPRTGVQMYDGCVDLDAFDTCLTRIRHPVVYNGDINDVAMFAHVSGRCGGVSGWMLGRGLVANPFLGEMLQGNASPDRTRIVRFIDFHDDLLDGYRLRFSGPGHVLDRMKGFWRYFAASFCDGRRLLKTVQRTSSLNAYRRIVRQAIEREAQPYRLPTPPDPSSF